MENFPTHLRTSIKKKKAAQNTVSKTRVKKNRVVESGAKSPLSAKQRLKGGHPF